MTYSNVVSISMGDGGLDLMTALVDVMKEKCFVFRILILIE